ncbi:hypothetical protein ABI59_06350 [Acidobacteria bacterium Mor1]|nr:hypothetical protein ABI59_06350 [Acidobacteria bacterium Mor1]
MRIPATILMVLWLALLATPAASQAPADGGDAGDAAGQAGGDAIVDTELWSALRGRYEAGLRRHVAVTDSQVETIMPLVEELEALRRKARRERAATTRSLRIAFEDGGADSELQSLLERLDEIELELRSEERRIRQAIEADLTVRQRVKYRFYSVKFRTELRKRLGGLSGGRPTPIRDRLRDARKRRQGGG